MFWKAEGVAGLIDLDYSSLNIHRLDPARLASINEAYLRLSSQQDADVSLKILTATVREMLGADTVVVLMGDDDASALRVVHVRGESHKRLLGRRMSPPNAGAAGRAYTNVCACLYVCGKGAGVSDDPIAELIGASRAVAIPMISRNRCIGTLAVYGGPSSGYTDSDLAALVQLASYGAVSVDNSMLIYELKREKLKTDILLDRVEDGYLFIDHAGCIAAANRAFARLFGLEQDDVVGRHISELNHLGELSEALVWPGNTAGMPHCHEYRDCDDGSCRARDAESFRCWTLPDACRADGCEEVLDKLWKKCVHCGYLEEMSDRMSAPREVSVLGKRVRVTGALVVENGEKRVFGELVSFQDLEGDARTRIQRSELISMLSHDLKTPLSMIVGYSDILSSIDDVDKMKDMGRIISKSSHVLLGMINDLLEFTAIESGSYRVRRFPVSARSVIGTALDAFSGVAAEKCVRIETDLPDKMIVLDVDTDLMMRLLGNLIVNAVRYGRENGSLTIKAVNGPPGFAEITVHDDGPGVPEDDLPQVFDKYYRAGNSKGVRGTGLGLSIVKAVAEAHGGRAYAYNHPEGGAVFGVILPSLKGE